MRSKLNISVFPERLKMRRREKNLTQKELSAKTGISVKTINTWENIGPKEGSGPKVSNLISLCEVLECDFEYLFGGIDEAKKIYTDIHAETSLSVEAVITLCNARSHPEIIFFLNSLLEAPGDILRKISNKYFAHIHAINVVEPAAKKYGNVMSENGLAVIADITVNGEQVPKVPIQELSDYTRFELLRAFFEFADRKAGGQ